MSNPNFNFKMPRFKMRCLVSLVIIREVLLRIRWNQEGLQIFFFFWTCRIWCLIPIYLLTSSLQIILIFSPYTPVFQKIEFSFTNRLFWGKFNVHEYWCQWLKRFVIILSCHSLENLCTCRDFSRMARNTYGFSKNAAILPRLTRHFSFCWVKIPQKSHSSRDNEMKSA